MQTTQSSQLAASAAAQLSQILDLVNEQPARGSEAEARKPEAISALRAFGDAYDEAGTPELAEQAREATRLADLLARHDLTALCNVANEGGFDPTSKEPLHRVHRFWLGIRAELQG